MAAHVDLRAKAGTKKIFSDLLPLVDGTPLRVAKGFCEKFFLPPALARSTRPGSSLLPAASPCGAVIHGDGCVDQACPSVDKYPCALDRTGVQKGLTMCHYEELDPIECDTIYLHQNRDGLFTELLQVSVMTDPNEGSFYFIASFHLEHEAAGVLHDDIACPDTTGDVEAFIAQHKGFPTLAETLEADDIPS